MKKFKSVIALLLAALMFAGCFATASAAAVEEKEPNETVAAATELKADETIAGSLLSASDVDYFKIAPKVSGIASVEFAHEAQTAADASISYFKISVYASDAADAAAVAAVTSAGSSTIDTAEFLVIAGQTYYVRVTAGDVCDSTVDYTLAYSVESGVAAEKEPNNSPVTANSFELSLSGSPKHHYGAVSVDDADYYDFKVTASGALNIYFYNDFTPKGNFNATVYAYAEGAAGEQVLEPVTTVSITDKEATVIGPTVCVQPGDYVLCITGAGSYKTRILYRAASNIEAENNDSMLQANEIALGTTYKATIDEAKDKDYFKFNVAADNKGFDITFASKSEGKWVVALYNSDNELVTDALNVEIKAGVSSAKIETAPLAAGTYYIKVTAGDKLGTDLYDIKVAERAEAIDDGKDDNLSLIDRIKALNWGILVGNLEGWFDQVNIKGLMGDIGSSLVFLFTFLGSFFG